MDESAQRNLMMRLLASTKSSEIRAILASLGDSDVATLDVPFGPHHLVWRAFGGNPSNISTIGLGTKPGRSLTERVTNAIDAVLEERVSDGVTPPTSPRAAASLWFGRPESGPDQGLFVWKNPPSGFGRKIHVVMSPSEKESAPTVDVQDNGVGIPGSRFPKTILSLQGANKLNKRYLIGAFGQGGASTLAFCDYTIIVSRYKHSPHRVAFTIVRVLRLDETYKEDCYAYLGHEDEDSAGSHVFEVDMGDAPLRPYDNDSVDHQVTGLDHGTFVRHVCYRLTNLDKGLQAASGNLYHYLHYSLFDPLIPFRIVDFRLEKTKNENVSGARNRLMRLRSQGLGEDDEDTKNVTIRHYRSMEFVSPMSFGEPTIGIEYWVVYAQRKQGEAGELQLRAYSNELFVDKLHPIIGTLNGQNQGEFTASLLKQIGLTLVARHIVVHIDASRADNTTRRELFATSREGFKDGPVLEYLLQMLRTILLDDTELPNIEKELTDRLSSKEADATKSEVKQEVARLLKEAGLTISDAGVVEVSGHGMPSQVDKQTGPRPVTHDPLPTLPYPEVSYFEIVYPESSFELPLNDTQSVIINTDADAAYDASVKIRSEPHLLEVATKSALRGGRMRWRLRTVAGASPGATGRIVATLTKPDGSQLEATREFVLIAPREMPAKKTKGLVPPFEVIPITPDQRERWDSLWPNDGDDNSKQLLHAYKVSQAGNKLLVFYSEIFGPYVEMLQKLKDTPGRLALFKSQYSVWIAYHAILQHQARRPDAENLPEDILDDLQEAERQTVGRVQARQAAKAAEFLEAKLMNS